jgi:hypothetical protein
MRAVLTLAAVLFLAALGRGAQAQITFHDNDPGAIQPGENVLLDSSSAFNVFGHTNQTNTPVTFTSDENIFAPAQGQARVEAVDGGYKSLCFELTPGFGFKELEFDAHVAGRQDGMITLEVFGVGTGVPVQFTTTLDHNGSNWFSFEALGNTTMTKVCITTTVDLVDTRQWRVGGVGPLGHVPEGSSLAMLGMGVIPVLGLAIKRRKTARK